VRGAMRLAALRVPTPALDPPGPEGNAGAVELQIGRVEDEHLPDLSRERAEAEPTPATRA
jgi:hypothetical protein